MGAVKKEKSDKTETKEMKVQYYAFSSSCSAQCQMMVNVCVVRVVWSWQKRYIGGMTWMIEKSAVSVF
jgi:hypothetical protein